jgi:hypothetical protein|uniref:Uncharacterized protein n=1 Tax=Sipha flava TaxID=143950 RepID=A0A2S2R4V9_9HEMI
MWIQMKTYDIKSDEDICEVLDSNKIEQLNNIFELKMKDVEIHRVYKESHQEIISFKANMFLLTKQENNSSFSLSRENCQSYFIHFVNIKNEKAERFSSFVDNLGENDRLLIIDGILMKMSSSFFKDTLTIAIRPENNSSVILLKCKSLSLNKSSSLIEKNLARITGPGCYLLFGNVIKTMKYTDENFMLLRIQCFDKSCIKIYKYPPFVYEIKNISNEDKKNGVKYDFSSNRVDILVKNPCVNFISLVPDQRIVLNNVKVKYSKDLKLFLLHVKGDINNLKADPKEVLSVKSRPNKDLYPIPNYLKSKIKPIFCVGSSISKNRPHELKNIVSTSENLSREYDLIELSDSSSDDNVNLSPCQHFSTPKCVNNKEVDVSMDVDELFCKNNRVPTKITKPKSQNVKNAKIKSNMSINLSDEDIYLKKRKISSSKENSTDLSSNGSGSPLFFNTPLEINIANPENQSKNIPSSNTKINSKTQCIGPCRLIHFEPSIFGDGIIVSGYCAKCITFIEKSFVKCLNMEYRCPKCSDIINLTFFFKMIFLYGKNHEQAIEVCCYNENAKRVIKKLTKKNITLENYLSNQNCRQLVVDTLKSLIINKSKVNIIVCRSVADKTSILLSIDTKYVITN